MSPQQLSAYSSIPLKVEVELDRFTLSVQKLLELRVGALIPLTKPLGENLTLRVGGVEVAEGEIVLLDQRMGLRIAKIGSSKSRMRKEGV